VSERPEYEGRRSGLHYILLLLMTPVVQSEKLDMNFPTPNLPRPLTFFFGGVDNWNSLATKLNN
jgi:hypothetical protein